jgi:hypothetical protein
VKPAKKPATAQKVSSSGGHKAKVQASRAPAPTPEKRKRVDWEAVERDYRTGRFTDQELATKFGNLVSRQAITKMAKVKGWQKDLSSAVRQATKASLIADEAKKKVAEQVANKVAESCNATVDTVLIAAETNKQVILGHRRDIHALRSLTMDMAMELAQASRPDLNRIAEILATEDATAEQIDTVRADVAALTRLPSRILSVQRLAQAVTRLQLLERRAFGLDDPEQPPPVDELGDIPDDELDAKINERLKFAGR